MLDRDEPTAQITSLQEFVLLQVAALALFPLEPATPARSIRSQGRRLVGWLVAGWLLDDELQVRHQGFFHDLDAAAGRSCLGGNF